MELVFGLGAVSCEGQRIRNGPGEAGQQWFYFIAVLQILLILLMKRMSPS